MTNELLPVSRGTFHIQGTSDIQGTVHIQGTCDIQGNNSYSGNIPVREYSGNIQGTFPSSREHSMGTFPSRRVTAENYTEHFIFREHLKNVGNI
jgi:hypothetical protein